MNTVETMRELTLAGLSQERAYKIAELASQPQATSAIILKAFNVPSNLIEKYLDITTDDTKELLYVESLKTLHNKIVHDLTLVQDERYFETLLPRAIQVKVSLLDDPNTSPVLREKVASDIIDRAKGKPRQSIEMKSLNYNIDGTQEELDSKIKAVTARIAEMEAMKTKQLKAAKKA